LSENLALWITPLVRAILDGNLGAVEFLLENGSKRQLHCVLRDEQDHKPVTPIQAGFVLVDPFQSFFCF